MKFNEKETPNKNPKNGNREILMLAEFSESI